MSFVRTTCLLKNKKGQICKIAAGCNFKGRETLADHLSPANLHYILDRYAQQCCPVIDVFAQSYHWSFMQVEYATDLVFRSQTTLKPSTSSFPGRPF